MRAQKFFFISAGILCLVATYQLGASRARADFALSGFVVGSTPGVIWNASGEGYAPEEEGGTVRIWRRLHPDYDLPVPASEVKLLDAQLNGEPLLVTINDVVWLRYGGEWKIWPPIPGGPVSAQGNSFGRTKAAYR